MQTKGRSRDRQDGSTCVPGNESLSGHLLDGHFPLSPTPRGTCRLDGGEPPLKKCSRSFLLASSKRAVAASSSHWTARSENNPFTVTSGAIAAVWVPSDAVNVPGHR
jgi:hypothetical protein